MIPNDLFYLATASAYLAGMIDGEGIVSLHKYYRKEKNAILLTPALDVYNNDLPCLLDLKSKFGGKIYTRKRKNPKHKDSYILKFSSNEIREILPKVIPYMKIKKAQAIKLYAVLNVIGIGKVYTYQEREYLDKAIEEFRKWNKRGA